MPSSAIAKQRQPCKSTLHFAIHYPFIEPHLHRVFSCGAVGLATFVGAAIKFTNQGQTHLRIHETKNGQAFPKIFSSQLSGHAGRIPNAVH